MMRAWEREQRREKAARTENRKEEETVNDKGSGKKKMESERKEYM